MGVASVVLTRCASQYRMIRRKEGNEDLSLLHRTRLAMSTARYPSNWEGGRRGPSSFAWAGKACKPRAK